MSWCHIQQSAETAEGRAFVVKLAPHQAPENKTSAQQRLESYGNMKALTKKDKPQHSQHVVYESHSLKAHAYNRRHLEVVKRLQLQTQIASTKKKSQLELRCDMAALRRAQLLVNRKEQANQSPIKQNQAVAHRLEPGCQSSVADCHFHQQHRLRGAAARESLPVAAQDCCLKVALHESRERSKVEALCQEARAGLRAAAAEDGNLEDTIRESRDRSKFEEVCQEARACSITAPKHGNLEAALYESREQPDLEEWRQEAMSCLIAAAEDGRLEAALRETWDRSKLEELRQEARACLIAAAEHGHLETTLRESREQSDLEELRQEAMAAVLVAAEDGRLEAALRESWERSKLEELRHEAMACLIGAAEHGYLEAAPYESRELSDLEDLRQQAIAALLAAAEDGRLEAALRESAERSRLEEWREKVRASLLAAAGDGRLEAAVHATRERSELEELRQEARESLLAAAEDGRLEAALDAARCESRERSKMEESRKEARESFLAAAEDARLETAVLETSEQSIHDSGERSKLEQLRQEAMANSAAWDGRLKPALCDSRGHPELEELRQEARASLLAAAQDGRLALVLRESKQRREIEQVRQDAKKSFLSAAWDGRLGNALKEAKEHAEVEKLRLEACQAFLRTSQNGTLQDACKSGKRQHGAAQLPQREACGKVHASRQQDKVKVIKSRCGLSSAVSLTVFGTRFLSQLPTAVQRACADKARSQNLQKSLVANRVINEQQRILANQRRALLEKMKLAADRFQQAVDKKRTRASAHCTAVQAKSLASRQHKALLLDEMENRFAGMQHRADASRKAWLAQRRNAARMHNDAIQHKVSLLRQSTWTLLEEPEIYTATSLLGVENQNPFELTLCAQTAGGIAFVVQLGQPAGRTSKTSVQKRLEAYSITKKLATTRKVQRSSHAVGEEHLQKAQARNRRHHVVVKTVQLQSQLALAWQKMQLALRCDRAALRRSQVLMIKKAHVAQSFQRVKARAALRKVTQDALAKITKTAVKEDTHSNSMTITLANPELPTLRMSRAEKARELNVRKLETSRRVRRENIASQTHKQWWLRQRLHMAAARRNCQLAERKFIASRHIHAATVQLVMSRERNVCNREAQALKLAAKMTNASAVSQESLNQRRNFARKHNADVLRKLLQQRQMDAELCIQLLTKKLLKAGRHIHAATVQLILVQDRAEKAKARNCKTMKAAVQVRSQQAVALAEKQGCLDLRMQQAADRRDRILSHRRSQAATRCKVVKEDVTKSANSWLTRFLALLK